MARPGEYPPDVTQGGRRPEFERWRADVAALEDILLRVGAMVDAHPSIVELDANPVVVHPGGAVIVDARVRVAAPPVVPPLIATLR